MKEKQYDPARNNEESPAAGMASVNTHSPAENSPTEKENNLKADEDDRRLVNNKDNDRQ